MIPNGSGSDPLGIPRLLLEAYDYFQLKKTWKCSQTSKNCSEASISCWGEEEGKVLA